MVEMKRNAAATRRGSMRIVLAGRGVRCNRMEGHAPVIATPSSAGATFERWTMTGAVPLVARTLVFVTLASFEHANPLVRMRQPDRQGEAFAFMAFDG